MILIINNYSFDCAANVKMSDKLSKYIIRIQHCEQ